VVNPNPILQASQDFVSATNALVQAESDYFDEIQAASDADHQLRASLDYVEHNGDFTDISNRLQKKVDFSPAKSARLTAMKQLQNYAQVIASITSSADASWISTDANNLISDSNKILKAAGATQLNAQQAGLIQTAVTDLGNAVIKAAVAKELHILAQESREPIKVIANMVAEDEQNIEGNNFAPGLAFDQTDALINILKALYNDKQVNSEQRFSAVRTFTNWKPILVTKGKAIKAAVTKLQTANDAMAKKQDLSTIGGLVKQAHVLAAGAIGKSSTSK
jgi:hypothetical protein